MRGDTKSLVAMSLLPSPSLTRRTTSRSVGVSDAQPLAGVCVHRGHAAHRRSPRQWTGRCPRPTRRQSLPRPSHFAALPPKLRSRRPRSGTARRRCAPGWRVPRRRAAPLRGDCRHRRPARRGTRGCRERPGAETFGTHASASWASRSACSGSPCAIATRARVVSAHISPAQPGAIATASSAQRRAAIRSPPASAAAR